MRPLVGPLGAEGRSVRGVTAASNKSRAGVKYRVRPSYGARRRGTRPRTLGRGECHTANAEKNVIHSLMEKGRKPAERRNISTTRSQSAFRSARAARDHFPAPSHREGGGDELQHSQPCGAAVIKAVAVYTQGRAAARAGEAAGQRWPPGGVRGRHSGTGPLTGRCGKLMKNVAAPRPRSPGALRTSHSRECRSSAAPVPLQGRVAGPQPGDDLMARRGWAIVV